jgi:hypothetical protein
MVVEIVAEIAVAGMIAAGMKECLLEHCRWPEG